MSHPWQSAKDHFEKVLFPKLEKIGKEVGRQSQTNENAKAIITAYELLRRSFDPLTMIQLEKAMEAWEAEPTNKIVKWGVGFGDEE